MLKCYFSQQDLRFFMNRPHKEGIIHFIEEGKEGVIFKNKVLFIGQKVIGLSIFFKTL